MQECSETKRNRNYWIFGTKMECVVVVLLHPYAKQSNTHTHFIKKLKGKTTAALFQCSQKPEKTKRIKTKRLKHELMKYIPEERRDTALCRLDSNERRCTWFRKTWSRKKKINFSFNLLIAPIFGSFCFALISAIRKMFYIHENDITPGPNARRYTRKCGNCNIGLVEKVHSSITTTIFQCAL